jgi:hypothetical protein
MMVLLYQFTASIDLKPLWLESMTTFANAHIEVTNIRGQGHHNHLNKD